MSRTAEIIEGNTVIDPYVNQAISKGLFSPIEYNFAAGFDQDLPAPALFTNTTNTLKLPCTSSSHRTISGKTKRYFELTSTPISPMPLCRIIW